jgi:prepilin-type processing-associated H-X9-DG protein
LLVVIAIIGVLVGLAIPASQRIRGAAQRVACANNLHQLGLAAQNYLAAHKHFPPGIVSADAAQSDMPSSSWLVHLLPYVENDNLYRDSVAAYRAGESPFLGTHVGRQLPISTFQCPSDPRSGKPQWTHDRLVALTSYVGTCGLDYTTRDGVLFCDSAIRPAEVADGLSQTIFAGERPPSADNWYGWWYAGMGQDASGSPDMLLGVREVNDGARFADTCPPGPYHFEAGNLDEQCHLFHYWSLHSSGAHFLFCDGTVKFLAYDADDILPALATRSGGEVVRY